MNKQIKYFSSKAEETDTRVLTFIGSTEDLDRDKEVIKLSAWKLKEYKKNPVVLVNHNPMNLPVARTKRVWVDRDAKALKFEIEFPEPEVSPQGDTLYKLYKNGYMKATSVGFTADYEKIDFGDTSKGQPRATFKDVELLEISLVSIPANPRALISSKSFEEALEKEIVDELEIKDLQTFLDEYLDETEANKPVEKQADKKADDEIINKDVTCECCDKVISKICPECAENKASEDYFEKLYNDILTDRETSA